MVTDQPAGGSQAVPKAFALAYSQARGFDGVMGDDKAKNKLAEKAFPLMTATMLRERDPDGEVESWFRRIAEMLA